jgi:hypothetical protein
MGSPAGTRLVGAVSLCQMGYRLSAIGFWSLAIGIAQRVMPLPMIPFDFFDFFTLFALNVLTLPSCAR